MSLFPHPPLSSTRRTGRGGVGNLQYDSTAQEPDPGPEKHLLPKTHFKTLGQRSGRAGVCNWQLDRASDAGLRKALSLRSPIEAHQHMPVSPESGLGSSRSHTEKGLEVRTWERGSMSIQQSKSKDLAAGIGTADKWRLKLLKSMAAEANSSKRNGPVEVGLAEEWRSRVLKSLTKEFHNGDHHGSNGKKHELNRDMIWFQKEERGDGVKSHTQNPTF